MKISHYNNCCTTPPHCYVIRTLLVLGIVTVTVHCAVRAVSLSIVQTDKFCPSLAPLPNVNRILPQCCAQNTNCSPNVQLHSAAHPSALRSFCSLHFATVLSSKHELQSKCSTPFCCTPQRSTFLPLPSFTKALPRFNLSLPARK